MGKPKDAKVWNEDLVKALDARHQKAQREGKRDIHLWRKGRDQILAVRKDIYQFRTGTIANLPNNLSKRVHRLCEDVIRGVTNVYPDGHVATNQIAGHDHLLATPPCNPAWGSAAATTNTSGITGHNNDNNNPFQNDHYMKKMKIRGGAFAILMAFRYSVTEILTKRDICREAQKFCDDQMESNYLAGRTYGSWKSIDTLKNRNLVKEQGYATYTPNGFRDRPHTYSLTRDGEMFIEALLAQRPEAVEAARQAAGRDPKTPFSLGAGTRAMESPTLPGIRSTPLFSSSSSFRTNKRANMEADWAELEEWIAAASVGDRKDFKVGKERRFRLHKLCDALQRTTPGLLLTHGSSGESRARTLSIQLVSKPSQSTSKSKSTMASGRKRPHSPSWFDENDGKETQTSLFERSSLTARQKAGLAAVKRQKEAMEEIQLKTAILESKKMASATPQSRRRKQQQQGTRNSGDKELQEAIQASLKDTKKPAAVRRDIFAIDDSSSSSSDYEFPGPIFSPSPIRKKQKPNPVLEDDKKPPAKKNPGEICCIDSDSDTDDERLPPKPIVASSKSATRQRNAFARSTKKKPRAVTSEELSKNAAATPSSINLCESSEDENDGVIEIKESLEEPIDLSNSQLSQDVEFIDDDEIMIVEDAVHKDSESAHGSTAQISSSNSPWKSNEDLMLTVWIDNRERNRNATPRTLKNELSRHLSTGPLSNVWPKTLPPATVEEAKLEWGDIQYSVQSGKINSTIDPQTTTRLGVSIERKRVNDLVQRSSSGDHLVQLLKMKQHCSLSVLLIENDTRTARNVTPYNAQDKEGFDPLDPTIKCEDDVYRMFGRIILTCDSIKFMQTRDEQASLRSIGALGLMAIFASSKYTREREDTRASEQLNKSNKGSHQALSDQLTQAGIPWRLAKRVANVVGGPNELKALYDSCCNETAKSHLLSHIIATGEEEDQGDLRSSSTGWSDAIYRIVVASSRSSASSDETKLSGEAALLLHKELIDDHGFYLSTLYQGHSPEETLEKVLDNPTCGATATTRAEVAQPRYVSISLTREQATKYFPPSTKTNDKTFYKLSILSNGDESTRRSIQQQSNAITMRLVSGPLASKTLSIFELEASDIVDLVRDRWSTETGENFVSLAKTVARLVDTICHGQSHGQGQGNGNNKRILMVCGLQPALDANAKKSGYATETRTVMDLVFAELMLCYDVTILQALRKNSEDRVNLVKQLALACFHCGFLFVSNGHQQQTQNRS